MAECLTFFSLKKKLFTLSQQAFYFRPQQRTEQAEDTWLVCNDLVQVTFNFTKSVPTCEFILETELREEESQGQTGFPWVTAKFKFYIWQEGYFQPTDIPFIANEKLFK